MKFNYKSISTTVGLYVICLFQSGNYLLFFVVQIMFQLKTNLMKKDNIP